MRAVLLLGAVLLGCGGASTTGACEQTATTGTRFCHDFRDTRFEKGADVCSRLRGTWSGGASCTSLGYTKECRDGSFVKPGVACAS
ncbi:MAG: hypothetical protein JNJ54_09630 [Myxococcaceae bacterium]|nr:hypothetical protein [Myxococcaceae bacterium]